MSMATAAAALEGMSLPGAYRSYDLPWTADNAAQKRLQRVGAVLLLLFLLAALVIPFLPVNERVIPAQLPEEVVQLVLEPPPEPPKPPKPEIKKPEPKAVPTKTPKPVDRVQEARRKAESVGVLALKDDLKALRDAFEPTPTNIRNLEAKTDGPSRAERSILTSNAGAASGGCVAAPTGPLLPLLVGLPASAAAS